MFKAKKSTLVVFMGAVLASLSSLFSSVFVCELIVVVQPAEPNPLLALKSDSVLDTCVPEFPVPFSSLIASQTLL